MSTRRSEHAPDGANGKRPPPAPAYDGKRLVRLGPGSASRQGVICQPSPSAEPLPLRVHPVPLTPLSRHSRVHFRLASTSVSRPLTGRRFAGVAISVPSPPVRRPFSTTRSLPHPRGWGLRNLLCEPEQLSLGQRHRTSLPAQHRRRTRSERDRSRLAVLRPDRLARARVEVVLFLLTLGELALPLT